MSPSKLITISYKKNRTIILYFTVTKISHIYRGMWGHYTKVERILDLNLKKHGLTFKLITY